MNIYGSLLFINFMCIATFFVLSAVNYACLRDIQAKRFMKLVFVFVGTLIFLLIRLTYLNL